MVGCTTDTTLGVMMRFRRAFKQQVLTPAEIERRLYGAPLPEINKTAPPPSGGALEAKEILNNLLERKGTVMPDLQSALKNAIETWEPTPTNKPVQSVQPEEKPMPTTPFAVQNNVTRVVFDYVKKHPGTTSAAASRDLTKNGYKESSVTALMAQFVRAGLAVRDNNHGYRVLVDEYIPMKASQKYAKKPKAHAKVKAKAPEKQSDGIAALQPEATSKRVITTIIRARKPEDILYDMTVLQARELYDYLKKVFGG
jgi:hypothetical protein